MAGNRGVQRPGQARPRNSPSKIDGAGSKMNGPKRLGPCGQQLVTNLYTTWNVMALHGNNTTTSRAKNLREPATSTRLTVNFHLSSRSIGYVRPALVLKL